MNNHKIVFLDGATGSNLMKKGMPSGVCPEQWIIEHEEIMKELQLEYIKAGSDILYAPTFTANRIKLSEYNLQDNIIDINRNLVRITKEAISSANMVDRVKVAGNLSMTGVQLEPIGNYPFDELINVYKEQIEILVKAGVDLIVVETMLSLQETRAAVIACKETCDLPIMATLTFEKDGRTLYGTDARTAAIVLSSLGVSAIGANCSAGPSMLANIIREMHEVTDIPIIAKPNAGLPKRNDDGTTGYDMDVDTFVTEMKLCINAGASIIGGCCGTTPEYIKGLHDAYGNIPLSNGKDTTQNPLRYLTSERYTFAFSLDDPFFIIGERINPTGKKTLQAELREGKLDTVLTFVREQEEQGAKILDVNVGMNGIDEKETMLKVMKAILTETNLPLSIDSSNCDALEAALRNYPGRALVNSVSMETEKIERLLPIVKKYGAMFILLPLSNEGLPKDMEEKIAIIEEILKRAYALGFKKEDIIVDGLVTTVAANKNAALETLETIAYCKKNALATTCGLSNISFGLPSRSTINAAFLNLAIEKGLTMAIANPSQTLITSGAAAVDLLLNKEGSDILYIEKMSLLGEEAANTLKVNEETNCVDALKNAILKGNKAKAYELAKEAHLQKNSPEELLNNVLLPAIDEVGKLFEKGKYFLPQLIASAETMKLAIEYLEPFMAQSNDDDNKPTIVAATVEGDIHDIGKNLVVLMLKNHGFRVIDLGKDVKKEIIIETALQNKAQIIALSALMTTTMMKMKDLIDYKNQIAGHLKVMIGGAVITEDFCNEISADGYAKDAQEAVALAKKLTNS